MPVIAFTNQKGGVGKTTSAVNIASELARAGHPTLLVDLDPQANASSGLGVTSDVGTYELLMGQRSLAELTKRSAIGGLDVLPATENLSGAEVELANAEGRYVRLARALANHPYRYVIIDCPPSLGFLSINAMVAARYVVIPVQCEYYALEGLSRLSDTLRKVKKSLNPELELLGVLLTMYDKRLKLAQQVAADVRHHFPDRTFQTVIPRSVRLAEAPSHGQAVGVWAKLSRAASAYESVAKEVHEYAEQRAWQRA
jgi:chromosome partitioning protein